MASEMVRMDSNAELSQASSFQSLQESNSNSAADKPKPYSAANMAGQALTFTNIDEDDQEDQSESNMQSPLSSRVERVDVGSVSDATSMMQVVDDEVSQSDATSFRNVHRAPVDDGMTSQSESVVRLADDGVTSQSESNM